MSETLTRKPDEQTVQDIAEELEAKVGYCRMNNVGMGGSRNVASSYPQSAERDFELAGLLFLKIYENYSGATPGAFLKWSSPSRKQSSRVGIGFGREILHPTR